MKLNDNIFFIGQKNNIYDYLNISELYVCSSNYESSPVSIWEAMSMNLPIISTKVGDLTKIIIINGQNGYIIEKHDHILFSKKIHQLLTDKKLLQIGKANRSKAEKLYDVNIIANKTFIFIIILVILIKVSLYVLICQ